MWCCKRESCLWYSIEMSSVCDSYWSRDYHDDTEGRVHLSGTRSVSVAPHWHHIYSNLHLILPSAKWQELGFYQDLCWSYYQAVNHIIWRKIERTKSWLFCDATDRISRLYQIFAVALIRKEPRAHNRSERFGTKLALGIEEPVPDWSHTRDFASNQQKSCPEHRFPVTKHAQVACALILWWTSGSYCRFRFEKQNWACAYDW